MWVALLFGGLWFLMLRVGLVPTVRLVLVVALGFLTLYGCGLGDIDFGAGSG